MADAIPFQNHFLPMAALGRCFKLGDLYDYRTERILKDCKLWESATLESATRKQFKCNLRLLSDQHSEFMINNKWDLMCLDNHLQVSVMSGIIDQFHGASNYVNERQDPELITQTFTLRAKSRDVLLDLPTLLRQKIPPLPELVEENAQATHVVVGVFYGAEAYCVLTNDPDGDESMKRICPCKFTRKWENSLEEGRDLTEFKDQFDKEERQLLNRMNCRMYADFQPEAVRECSIFEAYKQCLILIDQVQNSNKSLDSKNKSLAVPIAVLLCPLKVIIDPKKTIEYYEVDVGLVARCHRVMDKLENTRIKADALRTGVKVENRPRLRRFVDAIVQYQVMLKEKLKKAVLEDRKTKKATDTELVVDRAENHLLFSPARLKRWLYYEKAELEMAEKMVAGLTGVTGISFVADVDEFDPNTVSDKKYALLLIVPSLNEMSTPFITRMEDCVKMSVLSNVLLSDADTGDQDGETTEDEEEKDGIAFHHVQFRHKLLQSKIQELMEHLERNKGIESQMKFLFANSREEETKCCYVLYEFIDGQDPCKTAWFQLPKPPRNLRIKLETPNKTKVPKTLSSSIQVEWDKPEEKQTEKYPYHFMVEYRPINSTEYWSRKKTKLNHMSISVDPGTVLEIRVAAGSFVGLSEFSNAIYSDDTAFDDEVEEIKTPVRKELQRKSGSNKHVDSLHPPTGIRVDFACQTMARIVWTRPTTISRPFHYCLKYRPTDEDDSSTEKLFIPDNRSTSFQLKPLQPDTAYVFNMYTVSSDRKEVSAYSKTACFATQTGSVRFANILMEKCEKVESRQGMDFYSVPFDKTTECDPPIIYRHILTYRIKINRTILLVGASGSGKTSLLNAMINYVYNVKWNDPFRFQLDQTADCMNVYEIYHWEGFRVYYSLTIIDTPGYGEDPAKNQKITATIRKFFEDDDGEQELDVIGFVMKSPLQKPTATEEFIYESIVSIFGEDIKENIKYLLTFADHKEEEQYPLSAMIDTMFFVEDETDKVFRFDNEAFVCPNHTNKETDQYRQLSLQTELAFNRFLWCKNLENICGFLKCVDSAPAKCLSSYNDAVANTREFESLMDGLESLINIGLMKMEESRAIKQFFIDHRVEIEAGIDVQFHINATVPLKLRVPLGMYLTNCTKCNTTCHQSCSRQSQKTDCCVMDSWQSIANRTCRVCPGNCMWNVHASEPFRWEYVQQIEATSTKAIKEKYEARLKRNLTVEELVTELDKETEMNARAVLSRFVAVVQYSERLGRSDLTTWNALRLINHRIVEEREKKLPGFEERIKSLKRIRLLGVINFLNSLE